MRLDRFIEAKLVCSARTVRLMFAERKVLLNGIAVTDGRQHVSKFCRVIADGKTLQARDAIYLMMHKPRGCVSATTDAKNTTILDLIDLPEKEQLHLAGRLDFNTTGLLLLTNDGNWSSKIMLPQQKTPKTYRVQTEQEITEEYVQQFLAGIYFRFEDLTTLPAELKILSPTIAELTIQEGRYHQIKRMFGFFQNKVIGLHRLSIGNLVLDSGLGPGEYRHLTPVEITSV